MSETVFFKEVPDWDEYFMNLVTLIADRSKDIHTQVGCVIVGPDNGIRATGYNSFPRGIDDSRLERYERPEKYFWMEHAERNAIYSAAKIGTPLDGCRLYCQLLPCMDCARGIIQVGIKEVIFNIELQQGKEKTTSYAEHFKRAERLLEEAGVKVRSWMRDFKL